MELIEYVSKAHWERIRYPNWVSYRLSLPKTVYRYISVRKKTQAVQETAVLPREEEKSPLRKSDSEDALPESCRAAA
jgi:hypothetical protein